jgi:hypothetical protein
MYVYIYICMYVDRLFFYAALETIRTGDVYNPGGGGLVPHLHMIDSLINVPLGSLDMMESFRLVSDPTNRYICIDIICIYINIHIHIY